jgi:hypothetical protein
LGRPLCSVPISSHKASMQKAEWILIYGCPIVGKYDLFGGKVRGSLPPFVKKFMLDVFREPWSLQPVAQDVA